ncbi:putative oxalate decarboxylase [Diaporthe ampelina]|uniref:Putative oxalate decarboxylase n=1 Tax=Diaporthe ampelina TaxID=1214573 RepID=A0A0G2HN20_9PEZI|nr:putative oxalate decarboxylase [Diaporthe ampelina]
MRPSHLWPLAGLVFWSQVDTCRSLPLYHNDGAGLKWKRDRPQFDMGQPIDGAGRGGPILGGTNHQLDLQNPSNLGQQPTDSGVVPNLKWSFSQSRTRISAGGWTRKQTITDLPASHDMSAAQQHLEQGAIREPHWHSTAEWGFVYNGSVLVSAVDQDGGYQAETLGFGDMWYFPRGVAHALQGVGEHNEFLLVFDGADTDAAGSTSSLGDWLAHTPRDVLAKNFGVDAGVFDGVPRPSPGIVNGTAGGSDADRGVTAGPGEQPAAGAGSFVFRTLQHPPTQAPGGGGSLYKVDSTNFPRSTTIAAALVTLAPGAMREMHWHPDAEEFLYFHQGTGRATVFTGDGNARTFDLAAGDTAAFPAGSGHYVENTSADAGLTYLEVFRAGRVADISLAQWLALTPPEMAAQALNVDVNVIKRLRKDKQVLLPAGGLPRAAGGPA